jgi:hypothetical protein
MKGGYICDRKDTDKDTMTPSEIKRIIRCCYKSKVVSDKIISDLECNNFSSESIAIVRSKLDAKFNDRYNLATHPDVVKVMSSHLSPIDDE